MAAYWLLAMMKPGTDPLGPDNVLVFSIGPLAGVPISGSSRVCVSAKSPLTGGFATSEAGGYWGAELRFAGLDAIVIIGQAPKPVYISIANGQYEINDASKVWGRVTGDAEQNEGMDNSIRNAITLMMGGGNGCLLCCFSVFCFPSSSFRRELPESPVCRESVPESAICHVP